MILDVKIVFTVYVTTLYVYHDKYSNTFVA